MANRKAATEQFLKDLEAILPGNDNIEPYREYLTGLSNKAFEQLMEGIERGETILPLHVAPDSKKKLTVKRNLQVAEKWGHQFFQKLKLTNQSDPSISTTTPIPYLVIELPVRRQAQTVESKMSVPKNYTNIDDLTGQPTGESKGGKVTLPELQVLSTHGLDETITEFIKTRGGDTEALRQLEQKLIENGSVRLEDINTKATRVKSTETLSALFKAAHLDNNL